MKWSSGEVAVLFGVTPQTIRNWVNHPELSEFFSVEVRHPDRPRAQSEFLANDIEVCNSIQTMLSRKASWQVIAEQLRSGWRDTNMPSRLMLMDDEPGSASSAELMAKLVISNEQKNASIEIVDELKTEIRELRLQLEHEKTLSASRIRELETKLHEAEKARDVIEAKSLVELELWRSGRLKPLEG